MPGFHNSTWVGGWGWGESPVALLLNKIKYLETEWKTPRAGLLLSEYSLQKLKNTTLMQKNKQIPQPTSQTNEKEYQAALLTL